LRSYDRVFADATHLTPKSRIKVINYVKNSADFINVIWMKTPLMECYRRNEQREGIAKVPRHVIKSMYDKLKLPTFKEGITNLYIIDDINKDIKVMRLIDNEENFIF
jgi:predicted kinase